jgi:anti-sigma regulatory factor (Ser/Thr protein kinase)
MDKTIQENIELLNKLLPNGISFQLTPTMLVKSTIDANKAIRDFLSKNSIFNFEELSKGEKELINCQLFSNGNIFLRQVSLVRPQAKPDKPGDPRIWIYNLNKNIKANDWIYFAFRDDIFFVIPISTNDQFKNQIESVFGELNYVVSSGLKNLIGKQLITDEFVAIFELVKNAFDAHANEVKVIFENLHTQNAKIIIQDDGKGMNFDELKNKWLFVGYSAKSDGTEDNDYRHNLGVKKIFAGAKGVGRFSCDRLGSKLKLITKKDELNSTAEVLYTDWKKFEENSKARFEDIGVKHEIVPNENEQFKNGTRLEISNLSESDNWSRGKLLALRLSLEKLILPTKKIEGGKLNDKERKDFSIVIEAENEKIEDSKFTDSIEDYYRIVNGSVRNLIFETLQLKTTSIEVKISEDGEKIETCLIDRGTDIYSITEKNKYDLKNIHFKLFHLNQSAKATFTKRMGFPIMYYGHVFVYKNGFRIYPFGDVQEDNFGVDVRKSDKEFSRIGTRSLSGIIEIKGDEENLKFIESTSRDAGFIKNDSYKELRECYFDILERLEKYVVDVIKWGTNVEIENLAEDLQKDKMLELISEITGSDSIINFEYNQNIVDILASKQENSAKNLLSNLQKAAKKIGNNEFIEEIETAQQRVSELEKMTEQAEDIAKTAKISIEEARKALEFEQQKNKYLLSTDKNLSGDMLGLIHNVKLVTQKIYLNIDIITDKVKQGNLEQNELLERLGIIKFNADKAFRISKLITKADFRSRQDKDTIEIPNFMEEYINEYNSLFDSRAIKFEIHKKGPSFFRKVSILDLSIVVDNLISNSEKKGADKIRIDFNNTDGKNLEMIFSDNGNGLGKKFIGNSEIIFDLGITDTDGSGIGLHTVKTVLKDNEANISFLGNGHVLKGASFKIIFN